jgi:preprotein translocase subunit SecE
MKALRNFFNYFKESREELAKVVWPTRKHVVNITIAVIVLVVIVGAFLGVYDYIFSKALTYILTFRK